MKEHCDQAPERMTPRAEPRLQLSSEERRDLFAALAAARESVKPVIKRLMESELVGDILDMRLDNDALKRSQHARKAA